MTDTLETLPWQQLMQTCPVGLYLVDRESRIIWLNETLAGMLGRGVEDLQGKQVDTLEEELQPLFLEQASLHLPAQEQRQECWLLSSSAELPTGEGRLHYVQDVTKSQSLMAEKERLLTKLDELKTADDLTGLLNRRALFQFLEPQVSRSRRYLNPLSVMIIRIEHFEEFIDEYGQAAGNRLLITVSQMLNDQMRWADTIGRLDTVEFLLILPETGADTAQQLAEKIRDRVAEMQIPELTGKLPALHLRFGMAEWQKGQDVGLLMHNAYDMLHAGEETRVAMSG